MDSLKTLHTLKLVLQKGEPLERAWSSFHRLTSESDMITASIDEKLPRLSAVLEATLYQVLHTEVSIREFLSLRFLNTAFYHGLCWVQGCVVAYFYFSDVDIGVVAIPQLPHTSEVSLHRFRLESKEGPSVLKAAAAVLH